MFVKFWVTTITSKNSTKPIVDLVWFSLSLCISKSIIAKSNHAGNFIRKLPSSAVDRGFEPRSGQIKDHVIGIPVFVASPRSAQHWGARARTGWLEIRITCPSGVAPRHSYSRWPPMSTFLLLLKWVSDCCLTPTEKNFSFIMASTNYIR
jgi:hypothetical protein